MEWIISYRRAQVPGSYGVGRTLALAVIKSRATAVYSPFSSHLETWWGSRLERRGLCARVSRVSRRNGYIWPLAIGWLSTLLFLVGCLRSG